MQRRSPEHEPVIDNHAASNDAASRFGTELRDPAAGTAPQPGRSGAALSWDDLFGATSFEQVSRTLGLVHAGLVLLGGDLEILAASVIAGRLLGKNLADLNTTQVNRNDAATGFRARVLRAQQTSTEDVFECRGLIPGESDGVSEVRCIPCGTGLALLVRDIAERRASAELHRAIVETAVTGIIVIDSAGQIHSVNAAADRLFGYAHDELIGRNVNTLMTGSDHIERDADSARRNASGPARFLGIGRQVTARRKDGSELPIHLAVREITAEGRQMFAGMVTDLTGLVETAISNAADRARLVELVSQDPLTGLANHPAFDERLEQEVKRAKRHGHALSLVLIDVDGFRQVNDRHGHSVGDQVLTSLARGLQASAREGDVLARLGGDEFAWLLPYSELDGAQDAAERLRDAIAKNRVAGVGRTTVSIGICELARARDTEHLVGYAGAALSWAKRQGGDMACDFESSAPSPTSPGHTTTGLDQTYSIASVYALSREVEAKDPRTREHARRVADLAGHLARQLGWAPARVVRLREAGLLHDVGKIEIPDAILQKAAALTPEEYAVATTYAESGARIIEGLLTAEQVLWVRHHHERHDGRGYPDGLSGESIPDGARILSVADSWDVMTSGRPYKAALSAEQAIAECRSLAGSQFCPDVVGALEQLWDSSALTDGLETLAPND